MISFYMCTPAPTLVIFKIASFSLQILYPVGELRVQEEGHLTVQTLPIIWTRKMQTIWHTWSLGSPGANLALSMLHSQVYQTSACFIFRYAIPACFILTYTIPACFILRYTILACFILRYTILAYFILRYTIPACFILRYTRSQHASFSGIPSQHASFSGILDPSMLHSQVYYPSMLHSQVYHPTMQHSQVYYLSMLFSQVYYPNIQRSQVYQPSMLHSRYTIQACFLLIYTMLCCAVFSGIPSCLEYVAFFCLPFNLEHAALLGVQIPASYFINGQDFRDNFMEGFSFRHKSKGREIHIVLGRHFFYISQLITISQKVYIFKHF